MRAEHHRRRLRTAALASIGALMLAGCASDDDGPAELTWYINPDNGGQATIAEQCSADSGGAYTIKTSLLPRDAATQREQLARRLAAGDKSMDIMSLDPPFIPELAEPGFLAAPPQELVDSATADTLEGAKTGAQWNGEYVSVPFWANTQLLWYRKSVAEAAGLDMSQPVTWDQIITAAGEQDKYLGVQGVRGESMTVWVNSLVESAGGSIVEGDPASVDTLQLALDTDEGRKAADIVGTIGQEGLGGPGIDTQDENASMEQFRGEKGSFMVNWPFIYSATQGAVEEGAVEQSVLDDIAWTTWPRVDADTPSAPPLGGINLGVGSSSEQQDLAWEAVECISDPANQAQYMVSDGNPASSSSAYEDKTVQEAYPMYEAIRESLDDAAPRPQTPYYNEISSGIQQEWTPIHEVTESTPANSQEFIESVLKGESLL
ncbi:extracellular solute-binding protein [Kocuria sp. p3-SID1433]|uniref:extracellular solute-binding protein n=1 Tax=unclassified Kocuria TaxID=2649579 RepID=UPI0021A3F711|nr:MULTISPECIES: extracellular solute-binding protein [unclassified Kocuria]MCT1601665.1 extracellular solute-binding protein [Kocuria sp. p3-SID1428]MCT2180206.1 extracellular solute-binding protein [Kocuria sp. p3-SID1433]